MTKIPDTSPADASGTPDSRRPLGWLDVVLTCGVTAAILLVVMLAILVAAANDIRPYSGNSLSAVSISLLVLEPVAIFAGVYIVLIRQRGFTWSDLGVRPMGRNWVAIAVLAALACLSVAGAITDLFDQFYRSPMINEYADVLMPANLTVVRAIVIVVCVGVLVPAAEELLFRGVLYGWLRQRWGVVPCTVVSAGLFAVAHANLRVALQIFITGAVLALLYEYSRSIVAPVVTHMAVNTISVVIIFFYAGQSGTI
jgi:CAAX protease family protein